MYTIKHAAEVTGLSVATLRAWERRYGVVTPHRTEAGYRLYDDEAVHALSVMASLVVEGWSPRQAADGDDAGRRWRRSGRDEARCCARVRATDSGSSRLGTEELVDAAAAARRGRA